jgi:CTP:molybdopterin cytidylyltransferase MocA
MTFALIPAGGKSARMGRPKLSLPLFGRTVLECVVAALRAGGAERVVVVVAPHSAELVPLAEVAGAHVHLLPHETPHMRATVEQGLRWIEQTWRPGADDPWLLVPADHPTLDAELVRSLLREYGRRGDASIIVPVHGGKRGHPVVLAWRHVAEIRRHPTDEGLNTYLRLHAWATRELAVASAEILRDLDTPEDYERLLRSE